ncbi:piggyBac transposable element-derived protein 4 [Trichonephila clavipes]|nr:piggyBac transposable element-derived protein 4 [Trichonephila clavipes]
MVARKRSAIDSAYIPDDLSDSESDFSFDSDINFSDCSSSSDESDHDSINLQSVRQWCKIDMKNIPPPPPVLFRGNPGITVNIANNAICEEGSRWKKWTETNVEELRLFFAVLLLQGVIKKPEQEHYWSKRQTLSTPIFAKVIGRNGFLLLMKFLHCTNNEEFDKDRHPWPKLNKIYELMEHLQSKFREVYIPGKNLSLDESLMKFKARHFASHIPPNPIKREPRRQCAVQEKMQMEKKIRKEKHESGAKTVKLDFALNSVSNSIILN